MRIGKRGNKRLKGDVTVIMDNGTEFMIQLTGRYIESDCVDVRECTEHRLRQMLQHELMDSEGNEDGRSWWR